MSESHQENWISFERADEEGMPVLVSMDLGLEESAPDASRPDLLGVSYVFEKLHETGLPDPDALTASWEYDDKLSAGVKRLGGVQAGRITHAGRATNFYYLPSEEGVEELLDEVFADCEGFSIESDLEEDPDWGFYVDALMPTPEEYRHVLDEQLVDVLEEQGDRLAEPRPVTHYLYFEDDLSRRRFIERAETEGFAVAGTEDDAEAEELPCGVQVRRDDAVELDHISEVTLLLSDIADECGGYYDGWETELRKG